MRLLQVSYEVQILFLQENRITPEVTPCGIRCVITGFFLHMQTQRLLSRHTDQESFAARDKFWYSHYFLGTVGLENLVVLLSVIGNTWWLYLHGFG